MKATPPATWLVIPRRNPSARLRLFCFSYAGGGTTMFRTWPDRLPHTIELCAVLLPGRESRLREAPFTQMATLVKTLAQVLGPHFGLPFAFWGHSLGAFISFELARQRRREQAPGPIQLFVSGAGAPQIKDPTPALHHLSEKEFVAELRRLKGTPDEVLAHPELMELMLPMLRADFTVYETYVYSHEEPLDCAISAVGGSHDPRVTEERVAAWRQQTTGPFQMQIVPGNHFFLHSQQELLLADLRRALQQLVNSLQGKS
jgi:surfactin synthase thioesterase subunit